jgi:hypothetical protein
VFVRSLVEQFHFLEGVFDQGGSSFDKPLHLKGEWR